MTDFRNDKCNDPPRLSYSLPPKDGLPVAIVWLCIAVVAAVGAVMWLGYQ